jgi:phosphopentomutase
MATGNNEAASLGVRSTYADVAATLSANFKLPTPWLVGDSFLSKTEVVGAA